MYLSTLMELPSDEEEQWISGEELYTEGSSDEDDAALRTKRRGNDGKLPKKVAVKGAKKFHGAKLRSTPATMDSDASESSQMDKLSLLEKGKMPSSPPASEENDSEQSEISWRPKRGSIKLPNLTPEGDLKVKEMSSIEENEATYLQVLQQIKDLKSFLYGPKSQPRQPAKDVDKRTINEIAQELYDLETQLTARLEWSLPYSAGGNAYLNTAISKMNKLDALLHMTDERERVVLIKRMLVAMQEAKQETLSVQLQVREELDKLKSTSDLLVEQSKNSAISRNMSSFIKLCPLANKQIASRGESKTSNDEVVSEDNDNNQCNDSESFITKNTLVSTESDEAILRESQTEASKKSDKTKKRQHFIERNIKLAADGMGTLSITDEEKVRLQMLLRDVTDGDSKEAENISSDGTGSVFKDDASLKSEDSGYSMDPVTAESLRTIESKLELLSNDKSLLGSYSRQSIHCADSSKNQFLIDEDMMEDSKRGWKHAQVQKRLQEIEQHLAMYSQPVLEEVDPLEEAVIQQLVEVCSSASRQSLTLGSEVSSEFLVGSSLSQSDLQELPRLTRDVVDQLVEQARKVMPHYKFRHAFE